MYKRFTALLCAFILSMPCVLVYSEEQKVKVNLNGEFIFFANAQPVIVNGRTLIPLRGLFEKMGYTVDWEPNTKTAALIKGPDKISIRSGHKALQINQNSTMLDVPAQIINNSMMLPLRAVSEATGATVNWDAALKVAYIGTVTREINIEVEQSKYISEYMECIKPLDEASENIITALYSVNDNNISDKLDELNADIDEYIELISAVRENLDKLKPETKYEMFHIMAKEAVDKLDELAALLKKMLSKSYNYDTAKSELKVLLDEARRLNSDISDITKNFK